jgi:hypothetical protein
MIDAASALSNLGDIERATLHSLHHAHQEAHAMDRVQKRFDELAATAEKIDQSKTHKDVRKLSPVQYVEGPTEYYTEKEPTLDGPLMIEWRTSVLSLLSRVF